MPGRSTVPGNLSRPHRRSFSGACAVTLLVFCSAGLVAQSAPGRFQPSAVSGYKFNTVTGAQACGTVDGTGAAARICGGYLLATSQGSLVFFDGGFLRQVTPAGVVTTSRPFTAVPGLHTAVMDGNGVFYMSYRENTVNQMIGRIVRVDPATDTWSVLAPAFGFPLSIAIDAGGNIFASDGLNHTIHKIATSGTVSLLAGAHGECGDADGGASARFCSPSHLAVAPDGAVYVIQNNPSVSADALIRRVSPTGVVSTVARVGAPWRSDTYSFQYTASTHPQLSAIAVDASGSIFVSSTGVSNIHGGGGSTAQVYDSRILKFSSTGALEAVVGYAGDPNIVDGTLSEARVSRPYHFAVTANGTLYFMDRNVVRRLLPSGEVQTVAGSVGHDLGLPFGPAPALIGPSGYAFTGLVVDPSGTLYFPEGTTFVAVHRVVGHTVQSLTPDGVRKTIAGLPYQLGAADGAGTDARLNYPKGIARNTAGNLFVAELEGHVRQISPTGVVTTAINAVGCRDRGRCFDNPFGAMTADAGGIYMAGVEYDYQPASVTPSATRNAVWHIDNSGAVHRFALMASHLTAMGPPKGIVADGTGNFYLTLGTSIYKLTGARVFEHLTGGAAGFVDGDLATARFTNPRGITMTADGSIHVSDLCTLRLITSAGLVSTRAGVRDACANLDGVGRNAWLGEMFHLAADSAGNVYGAEDGFSGPAIRKITSASVVTTLRRQSRDGDRASGVIEAGAGLAAIGGDLFVGDRTTIRRVTADGSISTFTGMIGVAGGDDGNGVGARMRSVSDVAALGTVLYVADAGTIRRISSDGTVQTIAGVSGQYGHTDGVGAAARFGNGSRIAVDHRGFVYVAEPSNHTIRVVDPTGSVITLAGVAGESGTADGRGAAARFTAPWDVAIDATGAIYVADAGNSTIRKIDASGNTITYAGAARSQGTDDGPRTSARFTEPRALELDAAGNLYVADRVIRRIGTDGEVQSFTSLRTGIENSFETGYRDGVGNDARIAVGGDAPGLAVGGSTVYFLQPGYQSTLVRLAAPASGPSITAHPANVTTAAGSTVSFSTAATGEAPLTIQWEVSTDAGATWSNVPAAAPYSGATTTTLVFANVPAAAAGYRYRARARNGVATESSNEARLTVFSVLASPTQLQFAATKNGPTLSNVTAPQSINVLSGPTAMWTATVNQPWVQLTGASGTGAGQFTAAIINPNDVIGNSDSLFAVITLTINSAGAQAFTVPVNLTVKASSTTAAPFGAFDSPAAGASVSGSIAVTGWALDDIGIDRVEIWRDRVDGETTPTYTGPGPGNGKIFIANPLFVTGARPDVEAAYGTFPSAARAGWGYLLLTQGLWNQGNGPFTLYAFAYDTEGRVSTLGSKTITVNNLTAVTPFGSIDTPAYGQTMTGNFWNFGWALTPNATPTCTIPPNGVQVSIDSAPLQPVSYGDLRPDIAAAFPGASNGTAAGGAYYVDTSTLSDGTHLIGWYVVDSCNRAEGIGSRFFNLLRQTSGMGDPGSWTTPVNSQEPTANSSTVNSSTVGERHVFRLAQGQRIEVPLAGAVSGYQVVNGERRSLPIGSTLDRERGMFYWQPGPGFRGAFDLEFTSAAGAASVRIIVVSAVHAAIDIPPAGPVLPSFMIAGWALEEAAVDGTGIDAVHVWAHPVDGGPPIFLGIADHGDRRPDVGRLFGGQFEASSYSLWVDGLGAGEYDIVVYPRSSVARDFSGAKAVRVTVQ